jgi:hypothetical protein
MIKFSPVIKVSGMGYSSNFSCQSLSDKFIPKFPARVTLEGTIVRACGASGISS